jgi:Putative binding domain, N-terminal/Viral BACON domain
LTYAAPAAASTSTTTVRSAAGCAWTAVASSEWIVISAGQNGNGTGEVRFSVSGNTGPARVGGIRIAGQTMTINQASGCAVSVNPTSVSVGAGASTNTIQVTSVAGCTWAATSGATWIVIGESSGSGNGQVPFSVAANSGPARQSTLSIGGQTVTVMQAAGCTYTVTPPSQDVAAAGGTATASISTTAGCPWSAASSADWITVGTASGNGPAQVPLTVAPNNSPPRTGTVTVASIVLTINQASSCEWTFLPPDTTLPASGGNGNILVIVTGACTWTAASDVDWITITSGSTGIGNGLVQFVAAPNNGPARSGTITIGGRRYQVTEAAR